MSLVFIYQKDANLGDETSFTIAISEKKSVEEKIISDKLYLLSSLNFRLKSKDITKQPDYEKIKALSDMINATKKKKIAYRSNFYRKPS